jgi:hypothetical protein
VVPAPSSRHPGPVRVRPSQSESGSRHPGPPPAPVRTPPPAPPPSGPALWGHGSKPPPSARPAPVPHHGGAARGGGPHARPSPHPPPPAHPARAQPVRAPARTHARPPDSGRDYARWSPSPSPVTVTGHGDTVITVTGWRRNLLRTGPRPPEGTGTNISHANGLCLSTALAWSGPIPGNSRQ